MNSMFSGCSFLKSLPNISKWNTNNVNNICYMFAGCSSLISLPEIFLCLFLFFLFLFNNRLNKKIFSN